MMWVSLVCYIATFVGVGFFIYLLVRKRPGKLVCAICTIVCFLLSVLAGYLEAKQDKDLNAGILVFAVFALGLGFFIWYDVRKERNKKQAFRQESMNVVKTKIIDSSHTVAQHAKPSTGSAVGRAIVGDMIAGPVGAVVGASTAKQQVRTTEIDKTTFMVYYSDGTRKHCTVDNNGELYELYMRKLEVD